MHARVQRLCTNDLALDAGSIELCFSRFPGVLLRHVGNEARARPPIELVDLLQRIRSIVLQVFVALNIFDRNAVDVRVSSHSTRLVPAMQHTTYTHHRGLSQHAGYQHTWAEQVVVCTYPHTPHAIKT